MKTPVAVFAGSLAAATCLAGVTPPPAANTPLFVAGVVADPQYADAPDAGGREPRQSVRRLETAAESFNRRRVDFALHLGDFIDRDDLPPGSSDTTRDDGNINWSNFARIQAAWNRIQAPKYGVLGNHDWSVPDRGPDGEKPGRVLKKFGFGDRAYSEFRRNGWRFILLDGTDRLHLAHPKGTPANLEARALYESLPAGTPNRRDWNGAISDTQLDWLRGRLDDAAAAGDKVVCVCHFPIHDPNEAHTLLNHADVRALLDRHSNVALWLNGHNHAGGYALANDGQPNRRHHLTLPALMDEDANYFRLAFFPDRIEVFRAEDDRPTRVLAVAPRR